MAKRLTTEEWIEKAQAVHGDRYDYSKVVYVRSAGKVVVRCGKHGDFYQQASKHLLGNNCPSCSNEARRLSFREWLERASIAHGNFYSYSESEYKGLYVEVKITCPLHGSVWQKPCHHLSGNTPSCCSKRGGLTLDKFISRSTEAHSGRYDYSLVEINGRSKVAVICKTHGEWMQDPYSHMAGKGCPMCTRGDTAKFIERSRLTHGSKYDYSRVEYVNLTSKVIIGCPEHGWFTQQADNHMNKSGCPRCPARYDQPTDLYILTNGEQVKVGIALDPESRIKRIHREQPFTAELVTSWTLADHPQARQVESEVHRRLADLNAGLTGFDGATEWFNTTPAHAAETIKQVMDEMGL